MNAIVTGATKGIGRALVLHLAANNYNVALCARNTADIDEFLKELKEKFPSSGFYGLSADLENAEDVTSFAQYAAAKLGDVDVLVNNAGLFIPAGIMDDDDDALERQMKVNVLTPYRLSRFFAKDMIRKKRGHIFNICSIASVKLLTGSASYSISKSALLSLTKLLREDLMPHTVRVTAVLPGATKTDSWAGTTLPDSRFVQPDDVAEAVMSCIRMSPGANVDEIIIRPLLGEI